MTGRKVRFPTVEELTDFMDEAVPRASMKAQKNCVELEAFMIVDEICRICPELNGVDGRKLEEAVESLMRRKDEHDADV